VAQEAVAEVPVEESAAATTEETSTESEAKNS